MRAAPRANISLINGRYHVTVIGADGAATAPRVFATEVDAREWLDAIYPGFDARLRGHAHERPYSRRRLHIP